MLIRFLDAGTRLCGPYEWSRRTGMVQDVDAETAAQLLTQPGERFEVDESEPLLQLDGMTRERAGLLAIAGVGSAGDVAELRPAGILRLAGELGMSKATVRAWIKPAGALGAPLYSVAAEPEQRG